MGENEAGAGETGISSTIGFGNTSPQQQTPRGLFDRESKEEGGLEQYVKVFSLTICLPVCPIVTVYTHGMSS